MAGIGARFNNEKNNSLLKAAGVNDPQKSKENTVADVETFENIDAVIDAQRLEQPQQVEERVAEKMQQINQDISTDYKFKKVLNDITTESVTEVESEITAKEDKYKDTQVHRIYKEETSEVNSVENEQQLENLTQNVLNAVATGSAEDVQELIRNAVKALAINTTNKTISCVPTDRDTCYRCPNREICPKSLCKYATITTSIRIAEDINEALDIMLKEDPRYANINKSTFITDAIRVLIADYLPEARKRIDDRAMKKKLIRM